MQKPTAPKLSIVIPAYNEEQRLPRTLNRMLPALRGFGFLFEVVVVDDGSKDGTVKAVEMLSKTHPEIRLISDGKNRGRGAAVKIGVFEAHGDLILETDSDGSVADEAIERFVKRMDEDSTIDVIFGSREMRGAIVATHQPLSRRLLGYGFIYLTKVLFWMWSTTDFTLGFKMFRREAARDIFKYQQDAFFLAEAELVFVARTRGYRAIEMPVTWVNDEDSRVKPLKDVPRAFVGLFAVLLRFAQGRYR